LKQIAAIFVMVFMFAGYAQAEVAGTNSFKECAVVSTWTVSAKDVNKLVNSGKVDDAKDNDLLESVVKIPAGWSIAGVTANEDGTWMVLCR